MEEPVIDSLRQVNEDTWLVGNLLISRSTGYSDASTWFDDCDDASFTVSIAPTPPPPSKPIPPNDPIIRLVYDAGESSAVWSLGKCAFCKVKLYAKNTTPEASTLAYVREQQLEFKLPDTLYQAESNGRSYLFLSRVPGRTLAEAWPTLNEAWRYHYVNVVVDICKSLTTGKRSRLEGVDGKHLPEPYLIRNRAEEKENFDPQNLLEGCREMGMDCSEFVFYHADLGPGNIIVESAPKTGSVGIIDWELAGFFPRGWIRTKFRISRGLNLPDSVNDKHWWRSEVQKLLGKHGFEDFSSQWTDWWY
jgi:aminoglycoside phosphotransferase